MPYANGALHVGQIVGAYLPADVFVRYLRARGEDVVYICGTDEHGVPITLTAEREGKSPKEVVDYWYTHMKETFGRFGISFDNFSRTSTPVHAKNTQLFYRKLKEGGYISEAESRQMYSPAEGRFLPDRYVEGTCPGLRLQRSPGRPVRQLRKLVRGLRVDRGALQDHRRPPSRPARPPTCTWI